MDRSILTLLYRVRARGCAVQLENADSQPLRTAKILQEAAVRKARARARCKSRAC